MVGLTLTTSTRLSSLFHCRAFLPWLRRPLLPLRRFPRRSPRCFLRHRSKHRTRLASPPRSAPGSSPRTSRSVRFPPTTCSSSTNAKRSSHRSRMTSPPSRSMTISVMKPSGAGIARHTARSALLPWLAASLASGRRSMTIPGLSLRLAPKSRRSGTRRSSMRG